MSDGASYIAGDWVAISAPGRWLLVDLPPQDEIVQRCWSLISSGSDVEDVLDVVISRGTRAAPSFALVAAAAAQGIRAVARGEGAVRVLADGQVVDVTASGRAVWADEDVAAAVDQITLLGGKPGLSEVELPMGSGVTLAASVCVAVSRREGDQGGPINPPSIVVEPQTPTGPVGLIDAELSVKEGLFLSKAPRTGGEELNEPEQPMAQEHAEAPSYDFLFGATLRPLPLEEAVRDRPAEDPRPDPSMTATWHTMAPPKDQPPSEPELPVHDEPTPRFAPAVPATSGLIDAVPGWGAAAHPDPVPPLPPVAGLVGDAPDVVAQTTNRSGLLAQEASQMPAIVGPTVLAGRCPAGHLTPVHSARCRVCGTDVPEQAAFEIARPPLGVLRLSTGDTVTLDRGVFLGRAPSAPDAEQRPHLVRVASPDNDVSRTHAEVLLDGWHVFVRDLGSTNGTTVELPGQPAVRLRADDLQLLEPGAVITLADEIRCVFEVQP